MKIVHYGQSCVLLDTGTARLLFDPGIFSDGFEGLTDLDAVLITHQHPDHLDPERLPALLAANPNATLVTDPGSEQIVRKLNLEPRVVKPNDSLEFGGAAISVVGGEHAVIHPDIPVIPNTGFLVDDGAFYHPGDSFFVPERKVDVLGLPTGAPWLKASEAVEFLRAIAPRTAVPIHEAVLAKPKMHYDMFSNLGPSGTTVEVLPRDETVEV